MRPRTARLRTCITAIAALVGAGATLAATPAIKPGSRAA